MKLSVGGHAEFWRVGIYSALRPTPDTMLRIMKLRTLTLGCKVNQYETEYVREGLLGIGYQDALDDEPPSCASSTPAR